MRRTSETLRTSSSPRCVIRSEDRHVLRPLGGEGLDATIDLAARLRLLVEDHDLRLSSAAVIAAAIPAGPAPTIARSASALTNPRRASPS